MSETILKLKNINRLYEDNEKEVEALHDVSFEIGKIKLGDLLPDSSFLSCLASP